jgi:hypothetical protein
VSEDLLLLTPAGVSSNPLPAAAPEPSSWVVMTIGVAGFAAHGLRKHQPRRGKSALSLHPHPDVSCKPRRSTTGEWAASDFSL